MFSTRPAASSRPSASIGSRSPGARWPATIASCSAVNARSASVRWLSIAFAPGSLTSPVAIRSGPARCSGGENRFHLLVEDRARAALHQRVEHAAQRQIAAPAHRRAAARRVREVELDVQLDPVLARATGPRDSHVLAAALLEDLE